MGQGHVSQGQARQGQGDDEQEKGDQQRFPLSASSSKLLQFFFQEGQLPLLVLIMKEILNMIDIVYINYRCRLYHNVNIQDWLR